MKYQSIRVSVLVVFLIMLFSALAVAETTVYYVHGKCPICGKQESATVNSYEEAVQLKQKWEAYHRATTFVSIEARQVRTPQDAEADRAAERARQAAAERARQAALRKAQQDAERRAQEAAIKKIQEDAARKAQEAAAKKAQEQAMADAVKRAQEVAIEKAREAALEKARETAAKKAQELAIEKAREAAVQKAREVAIEKAREAALKRVQDKAVADAIEKAKDAAIKRRTAIASRKPSPPKQTLALQAVEQKRQSALLKVPSDKRDKLVRQIDDNKQKERSTRRPSTLLAKGGPVPAKPVTATQQEVDRRIDRANRRQAMIDQVLNSKDPDAARLRNLLQSTRTLQNRLRELQALSRDPKVPANIKTVVNLSITNITQVTNLIVNVTGSGNVVVGPDGRVTIIDVWNRPRRGPTTIIDNFGPRPPVVQIINNSTTLIGINFPPPILIDGPGIFIPGGFPPEIIDPLGPPIDIATTPGIVMAIPPEPGTDTDPGDVVSIDPVPGEATDPLPPDTLENVPVTAVAQKTRYLRFANMGAERVTVSLFYDCQTPGDQWLWLPGEPGKENIEPRTVDIEPGQVSDLYESDWRVSARRIRIWYTWANGANDGLSFKDNDLWLVSAATDKVDENGEAYYLANDKETVILALKPGNPAAPTVGNPADSAPPAQESAPPADTGPAAEPQTAEEERWFHEMFDAAELDAATLQLVSDAWKGKSHAQRAGEYRQFKDAVEKAVKGN